MAIHLKDFHPVSKEVGISKRLTVIPVLSPLTCLLSGRFVSNHSLMCDLSRRAQRDSFTKSPNTNSLESQAQRGHSGGSGDRTFWWTEQLNEVEMHTGRSLPVSCEFFFLFFFVFLFYFFFRSVFPVLPGGKWPLSATAQRVCFKSNGMFVKWLTLEKYT